MLRVVDGKRVTDLPEDGDVNNPSDDRQRLQPVRRNLPDSGEHEIHLQWNDAGHSGWLCCLAPRKDKTHRDTMLALPDV